MRIDGTRSDARATSGVFFAIREGQIERISDHQQRPGARPGG